MRATNGEAVLRRRARRAVRLEELSGGDSAPVLQSYLQKTARVTQPHFSVDPDAPIEEFARIADRHPVFRVLEAG